FDVNDLGGRLPAGHDAEVDLPGVEHHVGTGVGGDAQAGGRDVFRADADVDGDGLGSGETPGVHGDVQRAHFVGLQHPAARRRGHAAAGDADAGDLQRHGVDIL